MRFLETLVTQILTVHLRLLTLLNYENQFVLQLELTLDM